MKYRALYTMTLLAFCSLSSVAQGAMPPPPMPPPPPGLPIDGGLLVLFLIAFNYGVYKAYKISKKIA